MRKLLLCYVPALDLRRISAGAFPSVAQLMTAYPTVQFRALPVSENLPTIVSGAYPHVHGFWGPRLRNGRRRHPLERCVDWMPDLVTTTAQCTAHVIGGPIELATMPPRRRRRFAWMRMNIKFNPHRNWRVRHVGSSPSIFNCLNDSGRFVFEDRCDRLSDIIDRCADGGREFEMIDNHTLDYLLHWNTRSNEIEDYELATDEFVIRLHRKCQSRGVTFVLFSDHGQEPVTEVVNLWSAVREADLRRHDYDVFVENTRATLWWDDEMTGTRLMSRLQKLPSVKVVPRADLARFGIKFADNGYGNAYVYANPGATFFPNDFYQPIANVALALKDRGMRPRLRRPWHVGDHGYAADARSEIGFITLAAEGYAAADTVMSITDIAPSIMHLLGRRPPATMTGRAMFAPKPRARATVAEVAG